MALLSEEPASSLIHFLNYVVNDKTIAKISQFRYVVSIIFNNQFLDLNLR